MTDMDGIERTLGRLESFMDVAEKQFEENQAEHAEMLTRLQDLDKFKWKIVSSAGVLSIVFSWIMLAVTTFLKTAH